MHERDAEFASHVVSRQAWRSPSRGVGEKL